MSVDGKECVETCGKDEFKDEISKTCKKKCDSLSYLKNYEKYCYDDCP